MKSISSKYLIAHDLNLQQLASNVLANLADDSDTALIKMWPSGELLAGDVAANAMVVSAVSRSGFSVVPNQGMFPPIEKYDHFTPEIHNGGSNVAAD